MSSLICLLRESKVLKTSTVRHVPMPTGPLKNVGYRDFLIGNSRKTGLLVRLFYPTQNALAQDPTKWPKWLPHEKYAQGMVDVVGLRSRILTSLIQAINPLWKVAVPVVENGQLLSSNEKYPLLVFSHGLGGFRSICSTFCMEFASRGFVVAAVEHRDNSASLSFYYRQKNDLPAINFENEQNFEPEISSPKYKPPQMLPSIPVGNDQEQVFIRHRYHSLFDHTPNAGQFRLSQVRHRAAECSRAVDFLENLNSGSKIENALDLNYNQSEFKNALNIDKVAIMGHSFGGATTLLSAIEDSRFKVAVGLDAWAFPLKTVPLDKFSKPVLLINAETLGTDKHNVKKFSEIFKEADSERKQAVTITGSTHMQQCDIPFVFSKTIQKLVATMDPKKPTLDTFDVHDLTSAKALLFINKYLNIQTAENVEQFVEANKGAYRPTYA